MSKFKRFLSLLMALVLIVAMCPQLPLVTNAEETEVVTDTEVTEDTSPVTRGQWIMSLVETFEYTLSDEVTVDNYFADVDEEAEYYEAVMIAVYYGLIESLPGTEFRGGEEATREFAAQTLNACMGYLPSEEEYSYSEYESVTYPDDLQVAVEREWFALVDGAVLPEQAITVAEMTVMLADGQAYVESMVIDESHENQYTFKEGVIEITDVVSIQTSEDGESAVISIDDCTETLAADDIFVVYYYGLAIPYQAMEVIVDGSTTVISAKSLEFGDAIESMDVQTSMDTDPTNFYTTEDTELVFIEETTGEEYASAEAALYAMRTNALSIIIPKYKAKIDLGDGFEVTLSVELKNPKLCTDTSIGLTKSTCSIWLDTNVEVTGKVSCDLGEFLDSPIEIPVGGYEVPGVGGLEIVIKMDMTGSISVVQKYHMKCGFKVGYDIGKWKVIQERIFKLTDKGSSVNAELEAKIYLEAKFGIYGKAMPVKGYVYAEAGFKVKMKYTTYADIAGYCSHFAAYLYAEYGAKLEWEFFNNKNTLDWNYDLIKEENSPVKIGGHYEDGIQVGSCTRKDLNGTTTGSISKLLELGYVTRHGSSYYGSGRLSGSSSKGYNSGGEPITVYTYSLDEDNNATITDYYGNVSSLTIPMTLDGYNVIAIGSNAFKDRTELKTVIMQDNITSIGSSAFQNCTGLRNLTLSEKVTSIGESAFQNCTALTTVDIPDTVTSIGVYAFGNCYSLRYVTLSKGLTSLGGGAFKECDALTSIEIPKSLDVTTNAYALNGRWERTYGVFYGCDNLKNVTFEEGTTQVAIGLFAQCPGLESVVIPDTVTVIEERAFNLCTNLKEVTLSAALTTIGSYAFEYCTALLKIEMPDTVEKVDVYAFAYCEVLNSAVLSKALTSLGGGAFKECDALTSIEIPKSLDVTTNAYALNGRWERTYGVFYGCDNLKNVTFEEGTTQVAIGLFAQCPGLESVVVPDTVTVIEERAFNLCTNLKEVTLSAALTTIGPNAFEYCTDLLKIEMPDTVEKVDVYAFAYCEALNSAVLSKALTSLGGGAFKECDALTSIEIPKSLDVTTNAYSLNGRAERTHGVFYGCDNLKNVTFEEGITQIAIGLFAQCPGIETITIPDTVTVVEEKAFQLCSNLAEVKFSSVLTTIGANAFDNCVSLTEIVIPDSVEKIEVYAFVCCESLSKVVLSKGLTSLGGGAFKECDALTSIEIPKSLDVTTNAYGLNGRAERTYGVLYGCDNLKEVTFEEGTTQIAIGLFAQCPGIATITIPDTVTTIEDYAFQLCTGLQEIVIPESVTSIGVRVLNDCTALTTVTWPSSLTTIPEYTFSGDSALTTVNLPDTLTTINKYAFNNCDALVTFTMPDSVTTMKEYAFNDCDALTDIHLSTSLTAIPKSAFADSDALLSIEIPFGVTSIGEYAFYDCDVLETVTMANTVNSMGQYAFYHCDLLKSVQLSLRLATIPNYAFYTCPALEEIVIPYYTTAIGDYAFNSSSKLAKVVTHPNLASISSTAFSYPNITVFYGTADSYTQTWAEENGYTFNSNPSVATSVVLAENEISIAKGKTYTIQLNIDPADFGDTIAYKSNKAAVVTVDENGVLTAVGVGTATIKVTVGSVSASCKVTVTQAVTKITLDKRTLSLDVPETYQLTATITPTDASNQVLEWTSSNESAATVDENGLVTAVGNGTAVITAAATDGSGISASCTVTVIDPNNIPVSSITLNKTSLTMEALETYQLTATVRPTNAANQTIAWTSSDEAVAIVDENGVVTAIGKGTATITAAATDESGVSASCTVTVTNTAHFVQSVEQLESSHPYETDFYDFWVYTVDGALSLSVTFDEQTEMEDGFDYLLIYDGEGNQIGEYTGTELAGQTVEITGDTVRIQISSDSSDTAWGFKVTDVEVTGEHVHDYTAVTTAPTCTEQGYTTYTCECGDSYVDDYVDAAGHSYNSVVTKPTTTSGGYTTHTCTVCGDSYVDSYTDPIQESPFTDVPENKYYSEPVSWAVENGITSGTSATTFSPEASCTRAQVVVFLWRCAGCPEPTSTVNPFADVTYVTTSPFYKAILWAVEKGITSGTSATTFSPTATVNRVQFVTFLWRYMGKPTASNTVNHFTDVTYSTSSDFYKAIMWAVEAGVTAGKTATTFEPTSPCTRGQVVTFLHRALAE